MPRVDPREFLALPLRAFELVDGYTLHDVWRVDLTAGECTIPRLRQLVRPDNRRFIGLGPRLLFGIRAILGRLLRLDESGPGGGPGGSSLVHDLPDDLTQASLEPPGSAAGPFTTLYVLDNEGAYQAINATVNAVLVVAVVPAGQGHRFYWGTYLEPVGRITGLYMGLIDPFRRAIVYPGLESWLQQVWSNEIRARAVRR